MIQTIDENNVSILDYINQSIVILHEWKIEYFNFCFIEMSGFDSECLYGASFLEFVPKKDRSKVIKYLNGVVASYGSCSNDYSEFIFVDKNGKEYNIELHGKRIYFKNKECVLCSLSDITIKLNKTRKLKRILDTIPEIVLSFDSKHQKIKSANSATEGLYGIPAGQFEKNIFHPIDLVVAEDAERVRNFYYDLIDTEYDRIEYRIVSSSGETKWVRDEGEVVYKENGLGEIFEIYHFIKDITERKKDEEKIQVSERKYRRIFEHSTDPIFVVSNTGKFLDLNEAALRLFCFENKAHALSQNINDYFADIKQKEVMIELIDKKGSITDFPIIMKNLSGVEREVTITAGCKRNSKSGNIEIYQIIVHDISFIIQKTEIETYRRTLGGIADRLNNITQSQIMHYGLMEDYIEAYDASENSEVRDRIARKLIDAVVDSKGIVSDLKVLGSTVRKIYHKPEPPKPVSDGTGGILFDLKFR